MFPNYLKHKPLRKISKSLIYPILLTGLIFISGCPGDGIFKDFPNYNDSFLFKVVVWIGGWLGGAGAALVFGMANQKKRVDHYDPHGRYVGYSDQEVPNSGDVNFGVAMMKFWLIGYPAFYLLWWVKSLIGLE